MSLTRVRKDIDRIDREIVKLLGERMVLALESKKYKTKIEDSNREEEIDKNLKELASKYKLNYNYLRSIYEIIFIEGKSRQENE